MKIKLTTNHSQSSYGIPIFIDAKNNPLDYADGVRQIRKNRNLTVSDLAAHCGVSPRTVEGWEQGRLPSKPALLLIQALVENG